MNKSLTLRSRTLVTVLVLWGAINIRSAQAQDPTQGTVLDSIAVVGAERSGRAFVVSQLGIPLGVPIGYREVQRGVENLYATGQFSSIDVEQGPLADGREVLRFVVVERPLLTRWTVTGTERVSNRSVRSKVRLRTGRVYDPALATASLAGIDSLYLREGYYQTGVNVVETPQPDGSVHVTFAIAEGPRVAISQLIIEGNENFTDDEIVDAIETGPEGFFWFQSGDYDETEVQQDLRVRLPRFYADRGYIDFQVVQDTLVVAEGTGKATLILTVDEGDRYEVGAFETVGNRQYTNEQIDSYYPFTADRQGGGFLGLGGSNTNEKIYFDQSQWLGALSQVQSLYNNSGFIYSQITPEVLRREESDGTKKVDLRWNIREGQPAIVNSIKIVGNTITHEDVIRRNILMLPGDVFRENALIDSYQRIANLGFFVQPMAAPRMETANQQGDVDIIFEVEEQRTGNINFGASVGQGTGIGGFIGLDQPNLFGKAKRFQINWQFGENINDFNITYSDPAIRGGLISSTLNLHNTQQRFTIADLGRITTRGGSLQFGFPLFGSRFSRVFTQYTLEQSDFDSPTLSPQFQCSNCVLSELGVTIQRDTRVGLPFATGGTLHKVSFSQIGGPLGGSGDFQRLDLEGRWFAPLNQVDPTTGGIQFVMGLTAKSGFVWGDPGPHFRELFTMGGTQFGIPLRGYPEFSITPDGFDAAVDGLQVNEIGSFGEAYAAFTAEVGMRISQSLYLSSFMDAGNVWHRPADFNPTRLFRGAGLGLSLLSPLGPIGLDYAYGFDRVDINGDPNPGWKFHFKIGNFF